MPLMNPQAVDDKLTDAVNQINQILASFDKRLTELEAKLEEPAPKTTTRKASSNG